MALDRTWYDTLVDDDGSGMTGSVWDKADVDALMDAVDAELINPLISGYTWTSYTPFLSIPGGGSVSSPNPYCRYTQGGYQAKTVILQFSLEAVSVSAATAEVLMSLPFPSAVWAGTQASTFPLYNGTTYEPALSMITADPNYLRLQRMNGLTFPAGATTLYFRGQVIYRCA